MACTMIQIPHFIPNFGSCQSTFLLVAPLAYAVLLKLQVHFRSSYANSIKPQFDWNVAGHSSGSKAHPWKPRCLASLLYASPSSFSS